jgi:hypothetical protein
MLAAFAGPIAIHASMRTPLLRQVADESWLRAGVAARLRKRIEDAADWADAAPFPACPVIVHDGMGMQGPSAGAIARADREGVPILLTGHLPTGSPAQRLHAAGRATWIRMPTHPTLPDTLALLRDASPRVAIPHSCAPAEMAALAAHSAGAGLTLTTGRSFEI